MFQKIDGSSVPSKHALFHFSRVDNQSVPALIVKYHFYKIGTSRLAPESVFWLTQSWFATFPLEGAYVVGYPDRKWDVYASIKFEGPAYGGKAGTTNRISCDRVVLVAVE